MCIIAESFSNHDLTVYDGNHTGAVRPCKACTIGAGCNRCTVQIKDLLLCTLQAYIGEHNGVSVVCAVGKLGIPLGTAEDCKAEAGQLTINQVIVYLYFNFCRCTCGYTDQIGIAVSDTAFIVVVKQTDVHRICGAAESCEQHIHSQVGIILLHRRLMRFSKGNLMCIVAESVGNNDLTVYNRSHTGAVRPGKACATGTGCHRCIIQIIVLLLCTLQAYIGEHNRVSVVCAVGKLSVPLRTTENCKAEAGQLTINQVIVYLYLNLCGRACSNSNQVGIAVTNATFIVVVKQADIHRICGAAESCEQHIHSQIGPVLRIFCIESKFVAIVAVSASDHNLAVQNGCYTGAVRPGKTCAVATDCPSGSVHI